MNWPIPWTQILLAAHILLVVLTVLRVLYKQHNTGTAFAWLIILFVFPLFGGNCLSAHRRAALGAGAGAA